MYFVSGGSRASDLLLISSTSSVSLLRVSSLISASLESPLIRPLVIVRVCTYKLAPSPDLFFLHNTRYLGPKQKERKKKEDKKQRLYENPPVSNISQCFLKNYRCPLRTKSYPPGIKPTDLLQGFQPARWDQPVPELGQDPRLR